LLCPVSATVTPTPIIARPPAPPTSAYRRSDLANHVRTTLAARPHALSEASPRQTDRERGSPPVRERSSHHEQHSRPGDDDDDERREREADQVFRRDHG
jgi:hypothetical protein